MLIYYINICLIVGQELAIYLSPNFIKSMHIVCIQNNVGVMGVWLYFYYLSMMVIELARCPPRRLFASVERVAEVAGAVANLALGREWG